MGSSCVAPRSRHYYYPLHLSGTFTFAPTLASSLYLLLCRLFTWHFAEVAAMSSTVFRDFKDTVSDTLFLECACFVLLLVV